MSLGRKLGAKFIGMFWLVFGGCGSAVLATGFSALKIGFTGVTLACGLTVLLRRGALALLLLSFAVAPALAQDAPAAQKDTPPQVRELLDLLADPAVRDWLQQQHAAQAAAATPAGPETTPSSLLADRVAAIRQHLQTLAAALPTLPAEFEHAGIILSLEFEESGVISVLLLILAFAALGFGAEWLFHWAAAGVEKWIIGLPLATVGERLRAVAVRLAYGTGLVTAFAIGSVGAFLVFAWPPLLREIVLGYLFAFLIVRLTLLLGRFLFAPAVERFRIVPMSTEAAWFWARRLALFAGWLAFGWMTVSLLVTLGMAVGARQIVAYTLGLGLLAIGLEIAWRRPHPAVGEGQTGRERLSRRASAWLLSAYAILLWLMWFASAMLVFWLAVTAVALPVSLRIAGHAINHVLRPPGAADQAAEAPRMAVVAAERAARGLIIIAFALLLARGWHLDLGALTTSDTLATRLAGARRPQCHGHRAHCRFRLARYQSRNRPRDRSVEGSGTTQHRRGASAGADAHAAADPAQRPVHRGHRLGRADGIVRHGHPDRTADRRRRGGGRRRRFRLPDAGQGHHQRRVLHAR
jgi:moderate conductance mechanosensitive channel